MYHFSNITGEKYGRLTVIDQHTIRTNSGQIRWNCKCDCGKEVTIIGSDLRSGRTTSCGCLKKERLTTHGMSKKPEYRVWADIKTRCNNKNYKQYKDYGGRGIKLCKEWDSFENFYKDMGDRPSIGHEIDRYNNNENYSKVNCRWVIRKINNQNQRKSKFWIVDGVKYESHYTAAEILNVPSHTIVLWCEGRDNKQPRKNCWSELKYKPLENKLINPLKGD